MKYLLLDIKQQSINQIMQILLVGLWCLTPLSTLVMLLWSDLFGGENWSIRRKPTTCPNLLTNFII